MKHFPLTDAECAVLGLLTENEPSSGYRLLTIVAKRNMEKWAGLSPASVYKSLKKLQSRGLVSAVRDSRKHGRGPVGLSLSVTPRGHAALHQQVSTSLISAKEHSPAFKLALAFVESFPSRRVVTLIEKRMTSLQKRLAEVDKSRRTVRQKAKEPRGAILLFEYVHAALKNESVVMKRLIDILESRHEND